MRRLRLLALGLFEVAGDLHFVGLVVVVSVVALDDLDGVLEPESAVALGRTVLVVVDVSADGFDAEALADLGCEVGDVGHVGIVLGAAQHIGLEIFNLILPDGEVG